MLANASQEEKPRQQLIASNTRRLIGREDDDDDDDESRRPRIDDQKGWRFKSRPWARTLNPEMLPMGLAAPLID